MIWIRVVAAAGNGKKELQDEDITRELGEFLKERKTRNAKAGEKKLCRMVSKTEPYKSGGDQSDPVVRGM